MLEEKPIELEKVEKKFLDREILRLAIIAELDAVTLYEQLAATTENEAIREVLLDVAKEEKTHVGEFQTLLLRVDPDQVEELKHGKEEVEEEVDDYRNMVDESGNMVLDENGNINQNDDTGFRRIC